MSPARHRWPASGWSWSPHDRHRGWIGPGDDDVHRAGRKCRQPLHLAVGEAVLNGDVLVNAVKQSFRHVRRMSASLIGPSGSSTFRLSNMRCRCRSRARASLRNRHLCPSIMGSENEAEQSFGRPCRQCNGRSKRTYELTSSIVPRETSFAPRSMRRALQERGPLKHRTTPGLPSRGGTIDQ
jgi:hypothetical protein